MRGKCLSQEHNTMSPARAQTRDMHTNHEATMTPQKVWKPQYVLAGFCSRHGAIPFNIPPPPLWMELSEGVTKVISEGVSQSASFDLANFSEGYSTKWPFFPRGTTKLGLFLRGVLCWRFDLLFLWG